MMALSGIQIYKKLPQTNCKDCGFPTCLAFAMKLAAKQVELSLCPHVSEESAAELSEAAAPPVRPITLSANGNDLKAGNEVVLFRHEKRFFSPAGLFLRVYDSEPADVIREKVTAVADYSVDYVGIELKWDGIAVQADSGTFAAAVSAVRDVSHLPLILIAGSDELKQVLPELDDGKLLIAYATVNNWQEMANLAQEYKTALAVQAVPARTLAQVQPQTRARTPRSESQARARVLARVLVLAQVLAQVLVLAPVQPVLQWLQVRVGLRLVLALQMHMQTKPWLQLSAS